VKNNTNKITQLEVSMKKKFFSIILIIFFLFISCYTPSPFYGSWADNNGSKISFSNDGSLTAIIVDNETGYSSNISGKYEVLLNSLIFYIIRDEDQTDTVVTEWDIRGNMMYLTWNSGIVSQFMTLYKISN
jgi:hypothetical protein